MEPFCQQNSTLNLLTIKLMEVNGLRTLRRFSIVNNVILSRKCLRNYQEMMIKTLFLSLFLQVLFPNDGSFSLCFTNTVSGLQECLLVSDISGAILVDFRSMPVQAKLTTLLHNKLPTLTETAECLAFLTLQTVDGWNIVSHRQRRVFRSDGCPAFLSQIKC